MLVDPKRGCFTYAIYLNSACEQDIWGALRVVDGKELARRLFFILLDVFISDTLQYFVSSDPCAHLFVNSITWVITHSCVKVSRLISCQQAMYWFRRSHVLPTCPSLHGFSCSLAPTHTPDLWCTYVCVSYYWQVHLTVAGWIPF